MPHRVLQGWYNGTLGCLALWTGWNMMEISQNCWKSASRSIFRQCQGLWRALQCYKMLCRHHIWSYIYPRVLQKSYNGTYILSCPALWSMEWLKYDGNRPKHLKICLAIDFKAMPRSLGEPCNAIRCFAGITCGLKYILEYHRGDETAYGSI